MSLVSIHLKVMVNNLPTEEGVVQVMNDDLFVSLEVGETFTRVNTTINREEDYILVNKIANLGNPNEPATLEYTITPVNPPMRNLSDIWAKDIADEIDADIIKKLTDMASAGRLGRIVGYNKP